MEKLPKRMFDSEYYYKVNPDVAKARVDAYEHYFNHGIHEKRDACLNYDELSLEELKCICYNATPSDLNCGGISNNSFYEKNDMVTHLPVLEYYASQCNHVTEIGVCNGPSTIAFLYGLPANGMLESYDIKETKFVTWLKNKNFGKWKFFLNKIVENSTISETDLVLFSYHSYEQSNKELEFYASKTKKFLTIHNIASNEKEEGIEKIIDECVNKNKYKVLYKTYSCNGLLVLGK